MGREPLKREHSQGAGADHGVMRELNRSLVLDIVKQRNPISRAHIAKTAALAKPTVSAIVNDLIASGLVVELGTGVAPSGGGRPPIMLEFNARSQYVAGVHIGVHSTTTVIADARGVEVGRTQSKTSVRRPKQTIRRIANDVLATVGRVEAPVERLVAVGVCVPGLIDRESGVCLLAPNLGWKNVDVASGLREVLDAAVYVHNTSQAAAVAESVEGAAANADDIVFLYAGSGIGAGLLSNKRLYSGDRGIAGEIGHCTVPFSDRRCACGKVGCLETVATSTAIVHAVEEGILAGRSSSLAHVPDGPLEAEHVAAAAADGDALAIDVLAEAGRSLGFAASWMVNLFNPEVLVFGGGLIDAGEVLLGPCRETLAAYALPQAIDQLQVEVSSLGQDAEIRGAVLLAMQQAEKYYRVIFQG